MTVQPATALPTAASTAPDKISMGISACLLGHRVRYDGEGKLHTFLATTLAPYVRWVPVCPETECGLGVPRPKMRLEGDPDLPRLMVIGSDTDHTALMRRWARGRLHSIRAEGLKGFIFKSGSPSCGNNSARIFPDEGGRKPTRGMGLFARAFAEKFPMVPAEDDARLNDPAMRESFFARALAYDKYLRFLESRPAKKDLIEFHSSLKLQIMSHSVEHCRDLDRLISRQSQYSRRELFHAYISTLMQALGRRATPCKHTGVLRHMAGRLRRAMDADARQEISDLMQAYRMGRAPLHAPTSVIYHHARRLGMQYLLDQWYMNPSPMELILRNHI